MNEPLAERIRPKTLDDYISQQHLVGKNGVLTNLIKKGVIPSLILWGPPGVGKTTLANIIANTLKRPFYTLSAINSGVKDIREIIEKVKNQGMFGGSNAILFIDEIHRFSKSQQDSLLGAVEKGVITLIGATTENPNHERAELRHLVAEAMPSHHVWYCKVPSIAEVSSRHCILFATIDDNIMPRVKEAMDEFDYVDMKSEWIKEMELARLKR